MKYEPSQTFKEEHAFGLCVGCDNRIIARAAKYMYPDSGLKNAFFRWRTRAEWHRMLLKALTHDIDKGSAIVHVTFTADAIRKASGTSIQVVMT